jgi:hypothetical protein
MLCKNLIMSELLIFILEKGRLFLGVHLDHLPYENERRFSPLPLEI